MGKLLKYLSVLLMLVFAAPVLAQDAPATDAPWQATITGQIEAFRTHDAPAAFSFAGAAFQTGFPDANSFFVAIISSGYGPIMESRSHTFGAFQKLDDKTVVQQVKLVDKDQNLFTAIYMLTDEPGGWRVEGVQLAKDNAIGV